MLPQLGKSAAPLVLVWLAGAGSAQETEATDEPTFGLEGVQGPSEEPADGGSAVEWGSLIENRRADLDVVSRFGGTENQERLFSFQAVGLDLYTVLSGGRGDVGTLVLQPYVVRRDDVPSFPNHVEDEDDWELELHQNWFNLTRWGRGRTNVRVGHFLIPFGLEPNVDTHFALRQLISAQNLGSKLDWGASLNGILPGAEYELAVQRGSGLEYVDKDQNGAVAGRLGTPYDRNLSFGFSAYYGEVIDPRGAARYRRGQGSSSSADDVVRRSRFGVDATRIVGRFTFLGELSTGQDFEQEVVNTLLEVDWTDREGSFLAYLQGVVRAQNGEESWDEDVQVRVGARLQVSSNWEASLELSGDLERYLGGDEDAVATIQLRLRP